MTYQSQRVRSGKRGIRTYHSLSYVPDQLGPGHEAVSLDKSSDQSCFPLGNEGMFSSNACACMLSYVLLFVTPSSAACQVPLSIGFPRQEHWSGLPFPPPGDLPDAGIQPASPVIPALAGGFFTTEPLIWSNRYPKKIIQNVLDSFWEQEERSETGRVQLNTDIG